MISGKRLIVKPRIGLSYLSFKGQIEVIGFSVGCFVCAQSCKDSLIGCSPLETFWCHKGLYRMTFFAPMSQFDFEAGEVLLVDKPLGWTSFQVVKKLKWLTKAKKVGHAGTLDPLATGLLILCTGKKTKEIDEIQAQVKRYTGSIKLGFTTPSYDGETEEVMSGDPAGITREVVDSVLGQFCGTIVQTPPIFSAIKVGGQRAYKKARKGEAVEIKSREVTVYHFDITDLRDGQLFFDVQCSKGTYIRSLANDLGKALGCGGYLTSLRRESIGDYAVTNAHTPEQWADILAQD